MSTALTAEPKAKYSKPDVSPDVEPTPPSAFQLEAVTGAAAGLPLFLALGLQRKLAVGAEDDPLEREADQVADAVMSARQLTAEPSPAAYGTAYSYQRKSQDDVLQRKCECGASASGACEECRKREEQLSPAPVMQRRSNGNGGGHAPESADAPPIVHEVLRSPGQPLDASVRPFMESRFGRDLSDVRVHTDSVASKSAQAVNALAYTAGPDVVFAPGQYDPETVNGKKLLAHELAHVVQQRRSRSQQIRRQLDPQLSISMTPDYAKGLSDPQLTQQISTLQDYVSTLPKDSAERPAVESNLQVLRDEQLRRAAPGGTPDQHAIGEAPRPAGLPMDGGYALQPAPADLQALGDLLPEGRLITLAADPDAGPAQPTRVTSPLAGAAQATSVSSNALLTSQGFAAAGENSIIIVAIPRWGTEGAMVPESMSVWGHTAVGVRIGGKIQAVRGLSPASTAQVAANYSAVRSGELAVPAQITDDVALLTKPGAVTIEYPVAREVAEAFSHQLPPPGPVGAGGPGYTAVPSTFGNACQGQNCVLWATQQAEQALKGRIGPAGGPPITDVPQVGQAGQGPLIRFVRNASQGAEDVAPVEGALGPAVASGMPTGLKVLKVGGRVMLVVSIAMIPVEVYLAPPEQRERTLVGATGGFVGGFAAGAAAGLLCGPGAPVCSIVLGLGAGFAGSVGGRSLAEGAYDLAVDVGNMTPAQWIDTTTLMFGTPEQKRANCEMKEIEGVDDPLCDL